MASFNHRGLALFCLVVLLVSALSTRQINAGDNEPTVNAHGNQADNDPSDDNDPSNDGGFEDERGKLGGDVRVRGH